MYTISYLTLGLETTGYSLTEAKEMLAAMVGTDGHYHLTESGCGLLDRQGKLIAVIVA